MYVSLEVINQALVKHILRINLLKDRILKFYILS